MNKFRIASLALALLSFSSFSSSSPIVSDVNHMLDEIKQSYNYQHKEAIEKIDSNSSVHQIAIAVHQSDNYVQKHLGEIQSFYKVDPFVAKMHYVVMVKSVYWK